MKDYKRLTEQYYPCVACKNGKCLEPRYDCKEKEECEAWNRLFELEDKIESGELCDREEVRKETAKEILSKIIDICKREEAFQNGNYNIQNVPLYLGIANGCAFIREQTIDLMSEYGVELFGNSDKLEDGE